MKSKIITAVATFGLLQISAAAAQSTDATETTPQESSALQQSLEQQPEVTDTLTTDEQASVEVEAQQESAIGVEAEVAVEEMLEDVTEEATDTLDDETVVDTVAPNVEEVIEEEIEDTESVEKAIQEAVDEVEPFEAASEAEQTVDEVQPLEQEIEQEQQQTEATVENTVEEAPEDEKVSEETGFETSVFEDDYTDMSGEEALGDATDDSAFNQNAYSFERPIPQEGDIFIPVPDDAKVFAEFIDSMPAVVNYYTHATEEEIIAFYSDNYGESVAQERKRGRLTVTYYLDDIATRVVISQQDNYRQVDVLQESAAL